MSAFLKPAHMNINVSGLLDNNKFRELVKALYGGDGGVARSNWNAIENGEIEEKWHLLSNLLHHLGWSWSWMANQPIIQHFNI